MKSDQNVAGLIKTQAFAVISGQKTRISQENISQEVEILRR